MRRFFAIAALLGCACSVHKSELDETLEWMDNTYNPHQKENGLNGHGRSASYSRTSDKSEVLWSGSSETFSYSGCAMKLQTEEVPGSEMSQDIRSSCTIRFKLKDIDPGSIKLTDENHFGDISCSDYTEDERRSLDMNCDHTELSFTTRTGAGLIHEDWVHVYEKLTGSDHLNRTSNNSNSSYFEFDDPAYARRFAKAFAHAIELCGGRPSKF